MKPGLQIAFCNFYPVNPVNPIKKNSSVFLFDLPGLCGLYP
jgi:hypothetical protein